MTGSNKLLAKIYPENYDKDRCKNATRGIKRQSVFNTLNLILHSVRLLKKFENNEFFFTNQKSRFHFVRNLCFHKRSIRENLSTFIWKNIKSTVF